MDTASTPISALESLRTVEFKLGMRGYVVDEVDEFLDRAAAEADHLKDQLRQQQLQLRQAAERINQLEAERRGAAAVPPPAAAPVAPVAPPVPAAATTAVAAAGTEQITRMIAMAQQFVDQTQREAETKARELTVAAQDKAREIVADAQNRAQDEVTRLNGLKQRLSEDVDRLARQVDQERQRLRAQLSEFLTWVDESLRTQEAPVIAAPVAVPAPPSAPVVPPAPVVAAAAESASSPIPPPAPPRSTPTTIGQALNFDSEERR
jgi:cell division initiation protein